VPIKLRPESGASVRWCEFGRVRIAFAAVPALMQWRDAQPSISPVSAPRRRSTCDCFLSRAAGDSSACCTSCRVDLARRHWFLWAPRPSAGIVSPVSQEGCNPAEPSFVARGFDAAGRRCRVVCSFWSPSGSALAVKIPVGSCVGFVFGERYWAFALRQQGCATEKTGQDKHFLRHGGFLFRRYYRRFE